MKLITAVAILACAAASSNAADNNNPHPLMNDFKKIGSDVSNGVHSFFHQHHNMEQGVGDVLSAGKQFVKDASNGVKSYLGDHPDVKKGVDDVVAAGKQVGKDVGQAANQFLGAHPVLKTDLDGAARWAGKSLREGEQAIGGMMSNTGGEQTQGACTLTVPKNSFGAKNVCVMTTSQKCTKFSSTCEYNGVKASDLIMQCHHVRSVNMALKSLATQQKAPSGIVARTNGRSLFSFWEGSKNYTFSSTEEPKIYTFNPAVTCPTSGVEASVKYTGSPWGDAAAAAAESAVKGLPLTEA